MDKMGSSSSDSDNNVDQTQCNYSTCHNACTEHDLAKESEVQCLNGDCCNEEETYNDIEEFDDNMSDDDEPWEDEGLEEIDEEVVEKTHMYDVDGVNELELLHRRGQQAAKFKKSYIVYPLSYVKKTHLEEGNRIIMPNSACQKLMDAGVGFPMLFKIQNPVNAKASHCGVLEFSCEEGAVMMPEWMMKNLSLEVGGMVNLENADLDRATYVKLQPHSMKFLDIPDIRDALEVALRLGYSCLTVGDTIVIDHKGNKWYVDVVDAKPSNAVCVIETDVEVDFALPLDYKEPEKKPISKQKEDTEIIPPKFVPFSGRARRLNETSDNTASPISNCSTKTSDKCVTNSNTGETRQPVKPFTGKKYRLMDS